MESIGIIVAIVAVIFFFVEWVVLPIKNNIDDIKRWKKNWLIVREFPEFLDESIHSRREPVNEYFDSPKTIMKKVSINQYIDNYPKILDKKMSKQRFRAILRDLKNNADIENWQIFDNLEYSYKYKKEPIIKEKLKQKYGKWY